MNPALRDLANDQLGQWAERRLAETQDDAEEGFALDDALDEHLTLEEASQDSEAERTPSGKARQGTEEADSAVVA